MLPNIKRAAKICIIMFILTISCSCKDEKASYKPTESHIAAPSTTAYVQNTYTVVAPYSTVNQSKADENDFSIEGMVRKLFIEGI